MDRQDPGAIAKMFVLDIVDALGLQTRIPDH